MPAQAGFFDVKQHYVDKLIRTNLLIVSDEIDTETEWAALYAQALRLERWRNRNRAELIASLFGDGKKLRPPKYPPG